METATREGDIPQGEGEREGGREEEGRRREGWRKNVQKNNLVPLLTHEERLGNIFREP